VPALEALPGLHVVAGRDALDAARWSDGTTEAPIVLRFAPDEASAIGAATVAIDDADAIVVDDHGFVGAWCSLDDIGHHVDWTVPDDGPALVQGAIAGVPVKLWIPGAGAPMLLVAAAPYAHELGERLGWAP